MSAIAHGRLTFLQPSAQPDRAPAARGGLSRRVAHTLSLWRRRMRDREALRRLSYHDMRDIGATPAEIAWEVSQPFWREARRR